MKGTIDKIWDNDHQGTPYKKLVIDGENYSVWDKKLFNLAKEGTEIEFEFTTNKQGFHQIRSITPIKQAQETSTDKQVAICRQACIKAAAALYSGTTDVVGVIEAARRFEAYVFDLGEDEQEEVPPEAAPLVDLATQRTRIGKMILEMCHNDGEQARNYLFTKTGRRSMKDITMKEFADLKPEVEEDYARWKAEGPFPEQEEGGV